MGSLRLYFYALTLAHVSFTHNTLTTYVVCSHPVTMGPLVYTLLDVVPVFLPVSASVQYYRQISTCEIRL